MPSRFPTDLAKISCAITTASLGLCSFARTSQATELRSLSLVEFRSLLAKDEAAAMVQRSSRYHMGTGVAEGGQKAAGFMPRSAAEGSDLCKGHCARFGKGQPRNRDLGFSLIQEVAASGEPIALCHLVDRYIWVHGTERDPPKPHPLVKESANSEEPEAIFNLYRNQFGGIGTKISREAACARLHSANVLDCTRRHIRAKIGTVIGLWAAQGMTSWGNDAQTKFSSNGRTHHFVAHLPITGSKSENEVEGSLLIYLTSQFEDDERARAKA